ncbi:MAG: polysaccharide deacetylase family protein, partial [Acidobacteria bacterium]|nr:polysaccharide deacetylase family protein [Acidobacteriota bacterium]
DVSDEKEKYFSGEHYSTTVDNFKRQIGFLARKFEIIPLDALVTDADLSRKKHYASIIFDDGFFSVAETAQEILAAEQIPFAVFVNKSAIVFDQLWVSNLILHKNDRAYLQKLFSCLTNKSVSFEDFVSNPIWAINEYVNFDANFREIYLHIAEGKEKKTHLDAQDIIHLHNDGVLIGSHSTDHYRMNRCTEAELSTQIVENRDFLKDLLKTEIEHFAIPFGKREDYSKEIIVKIYASGHKFIYSTNVIPFETMEITKINFLFPRIGVLNHTPEELMFFVNRTFLKKYNL